MLIGDGPACQQLLQAVPEVLRIESSSSRSSRSRCGQFERSASGRCSRACVIQRRPAFKQLVNQIGGLRAQAGGVVAAVCRPAKDFCVRIVVHEERAGGQIADANVLLGEHHGTEPDQVDERAGCPRRRKTLRSSSAPAPGISPVRETIRTPAIRLPGVRPCIAISSIG